jgi:hypothetical protein
MMKNDISYYKSECLKFSQKEKKSHTEYCRLLNTQNIFTHLRYLHLYSLL